MTVQGPVKKQQLDGMSHRGGGGVSIPRSAFMAHPPHPQQNPFVPPPPPSPPRTWTLPDCPTLQTNTFGPTEGQNVQWREANFHFGRGAPPWTPPPRPPSL